MRKFGKAEMFYERIKANLTMKRRKTMAVSEDDVKEQEIVEDDFKKAEEIFNRIITRIGKPGYDFRPLLFALCLIYVHKLADHEREGK